MFWNKSPNPSKPAKIKPLDLRVGMLDNAGNKVVKLYYQIPEYVVYRTEGTIRIDIDDELKDKYLEYLEKHNKIGIELARVYSWLPEKLSGFEPINRQIARSIVDNIAGKTEQSKLLLKEAEERIKRLRIISGRLIYAVSGIVTAALMTIFLFIYMHWVIHFEGFDIYEIYIKIATCGALGGALSISLNFSRFDIDIDANTKTHSLVGASRIFIAMIASIFSFFAIKSGIFLAPIEQEESNAGLYAIAMIAGFSEMFVPNLMSNLANHTPDPNGKETPFQSEIKTEPLEPTPDNNSEKQQAQKNGAA